MARAKKEKAAVKDTSDMEAVAKKVRPQLRTAISFAILGSVLMSVSVKDIVNGHFTETWVTVPGKILNSSIVRYRRMQFPQSVTAHPEFTYSFIANGHLLESKDNSFEKTDDKSVNDLVAKFPDGKDITVHYLKANPGESYFDHEGSMAHSPLKVAAFVSGFLLLLVGMQIMFRARRYTKPPMSKD